jgi:hypothetical protein
MYPFPSGLTGVFSRLHVLTSLGFAADLPDDFVAGQLVVTYEDASESVVDLVAGVNTAEWAYDRADVQVCLGHTKVPPACSETITDTQGRVFNGHAFHVMLDLEAKKICSIEARLSSTACSPRPACDGNLTTALRIHFEAMTFER